MIINKAGNILFTLFIVVGMLCIPLLGAWGEVQGVRGEFSASVWIGLLVSCLSIPCLGMIHHRPD